MPAPCAADGLPVYPGDTVYNCEGLQALGTLVHATKSECFNNYEDGPWHYAAGYYKSKVKCLRAERRRLVVQITELDIRIKEEEQKNARR